MRAAIFYVPAADHALSCAAATWFARADLADATHKPRRLGFHATLRNFVLAAHRSFDDVGTALADFASHRGAASLGLLQVVELRDFIAIVPAAPVPAVDALAADVRSCFEDFSAQPPADDMDRHHLPFHFHMTLTERTADAQRRAGLMREARAAFSPSLGDPVMLDALTLLVEREPGGAYETQQRFLLAPR